MTQGLALGLLRKNGRVAAGDQLDELDAVADNVLRRLERNQRDLRSLDISNTLLTNRFFTHLADALLHNTQLQELYLDHCRIDDETVRTLSKGLRGRQGLKALSLENNELHCLGASYLARLLGSPGSRWSRTFGGYRALSCGPGIGLEHLSLRGNAIASNGAKALAEALMACDDALQTLSLEWNQVDDWGAGWFAMAMRNNNVLRCLNLNGNPVGSNGVDELRSACETSGASLVVLPAGSSDASGMFSVAVGQRLCTIIVSASNTDEEERCRSEVFEQDAYRQVAVGQRPISMRKHNKTLNIDEPACIMADSQSAQIGEPEGQQSSKERRRRPVSASTYLLQRTPLEHELVVSHNSSSHPLPEPPFPKYGERRSFLEEKEVATALAPSRWKWKLRGSIGLRSTVSSCQSEAKGCASLRRPQSAPQKKNKIGMILGAKANILV